MQITSNITRKQVLIGSFVCAIAGFFYCYEFLLRIIPGALQSELSAAFGNISATTFGQLSAFYYFAYSPMQIPVGILMDRFGPRRLLSFACFCCTIGSWMFTDTSSMLIASSGRFLVGFGSSFAFVGVLSLTVRWLPKRFFSLIAGLVTTLGMLGLVFGEVKVTHIAATLGWMHVLNLLIVIGAVLTLVMLVFLRDGPEGFVSVKQPLPEFANNIWRVLSSPHVWLIGFVGACLYTSLSVFGELWGKTYLEQAHNLSKIEAAETVSAVFLGWAVGAPVAGYLSDRFGRRVLPLVLGAVMGLISISLVLYWPGGLPYWSLNLCLFLYGVFTSTEIIVFIMAKENSGATLSGTVFAVINMIVTLGAVIFQPLVGKLLDTFGDGIIVNGEHIYTVLDYQLALSILPISLLLVMILGFFLRDQPREVVQQA